MNEEEAEKEAMAIVDRAAWDAALLVDRAESGDRGALFDVANLFLNQRHLEIMVAKLKDELTPLQADENGGIAYLVEAILLWLGRAEACLRNQCFVRQRGSDECAPPVLAALPEIGEPLLPCPFCGGPAEFAYTPWDEESKTGDDGSGWVVCQRCQAQVSGYYRGDAERRWNTRLDANQQQQKQGGVA